MTYTNAKTGYGKELASLLACKQFKGTTDGQRDDRHNRAPQLPSIRGHERGIRGEVRHSRSNRLRRPPIVRRASIVVWIDEGNFVSVNLSQFPGFRHEGCCQAPVLAPLADHCGA